MTEIIKNLCFRRISLVEIKSTGVARSSGLGFHIVLIRLCMRFSNIGYTIISGYTHECVIGRDYHLM